MALVLLHIEQLLLLLALLLLVVPAQLDEPLTLAIGPEGGWTPYEVEMLCARGFACHSLGARILRVETALPTLVGRLLG